MSTQARLESFRFISSLTERQHDISERLTLPASNDLDEISFQPLYSQVSTGFHSLFRSHLEDEERDLSGDIPPGSLEAPQMLPRAAAPTTLFDSIRAVLRGQDAKRREFGYEGKEGELRRPEGMRHWETVQ